MNTTSAATVRNMPSGLALNQLYAVTAEPNNYLVVWLTYADMAILNNQQLLSSQVMREKLEFQPILFVGDDRAEALAFAQAVADQFGSRLEICVE